jgi:hypothetical protein
VSYLSNLAFVTAVGLGTPAVVGTLIAVALLTVVDFGAYRYRVFRDRPAGGRSGGRFSRAAG